MDILFITDKIYIAPTKVAMTSVCVNNPTDCTFHIISADSSESLQGLKDIADRYHKAIQFYTIDQAKIERMLPMGNAGMASHVTIATYYRLFITNILPETIDKVLYLDGDIIVRRSLEPLWQVDMENFAVGCVTDGWEGDMTKYNRLQYPSADGYFNAGVLLINLKHWREEHLNRVFSDFLQKYPERILNHDQDVLNYCLRNSKKDLGYKCNVQDGFLLEYPNFQYYHRKEELDEAVNDPVIIHYTSGNKPWNLHCTHPYKNEFEKYMHICGLSFSDFPRKIPLKEKVIRIAIKYHLRKSPVSYRKELKLMI